MNPSTDMLMAYVDGELAAEEARQIEAEIAARPDLKAYVEQQIALRRAMSGAFDAVLDAPVPERLLAAVSAAPSRRWRLAHGLQAASGWGALRGIAVPAAALACGLAIGLAVMMPRPADFAYGPAGLEARGALSAALTGALSGGRANVAEARIGLSFRDKTGRYCRTFDTDGAAPLAGIACHQDGGWHVAVLAARTKDGVANAAYRPAGSAMPEPVRDAVQAMIVGAPLDADGERAARARDWNGR